MMVRLGFSQDAANEIFNGQGLDLINEWLNLDNNNVKKLLQKVQKPGGGGHGEMISFKAEMNFHLDIFFVRHKNRTSISVDYSDITVTNIRALKKQRYMELDKEAKHEATAIDLEDVSKTHEAMIQYLCGVCGFNVVPLSYVVQPASDIEGRNKSPPLPHSSVSDSSLQTQVRQHRIL